MWYPTTNSDELYHHQRKGARWGIMNGPPYPLGRSQLTAAEKKAGGIISKFAEGRKEKKKKKQRAKALEKARQTRKANAEKKAQEEYAAKEKDRILKSGTPEEVGKLKGHVTNDELQYALTRFDKEDSLNKRIQANMPPSSYDKFMAISKKAGDIATASQNYINLYNNGAKVYNSFIAGPRGKKKMIIIGEGGGNNNNQNNQNNNQQNNNQGGGKKKKKK